jgi:hypothetical protein
VDGRSCSWSNLLHILLLVVSEIDVRLCDKIDDVACYVILIIIQCVYILPATKRHIVASALLYGFSYPQASAKR